MSEGQPIKASRQVRIRRGRAASKQAGVRRAGRYRMYGDRACTLLLTDESESKRADDVHGGRVKIMSRPGEVH